MQDCTVTLAFPADLECLAVIGGRYRKNGKNGQWEQVSGPQWKRLESGTIQAVFRKRRELKLCLAVMDEISRQEPKEEQLCFSAETSRE